MSPCCSCSPIRRWWWAWLLNASGGQRTVIQWHTAIIIFNFSYWQLKTNHMWIFYQLKKRNKHNFLAVICKRGRQAEAIAERNTVQQIASKMDQIYNLVTIMGFYRLEDLIYQRSAIPIFGHTTLTVDNDPVWNPVWPQKRQGEKK